MKLGEQGGINHNGVGGRDGGPESDDRRVELVVCGDMKRGVRVYMNR